MKNSTEITRPRSVIVTEIKFEYSEFERNIGEMQRGAKYKIGGLLRELRMSFLGGREGDLEFHKYCDQQKVPLQRNPRVEWMKYYVRLKGRTQSADGVPTKLPPLRPTINRGYVEPRYTDRKLADEYKKKIEAAFKRHKQFDIERQNREKEDSLIEELANKIIDVGYRVLSIKLHPDKGGSDEAMRRLGAAKEMLKKALTRRLITI